MTRQRKFDFLPKEVRSSYINEIIGFFQNERDEIIGYVAAEQFLDFFLENVGEDIYKRGLRDAGKIVRAKLEDLETELDILSN